MACAAIALVLAAAPGCSGGGDANASAKSPGANPAANGSDAPNGAASGGQSATSAGSAKPETRTAQQILKDMETAYRNAKSYADAGAVHVHFERDGSVYDDNLNFSVAFVRPNKLRLICYEAMAVSDGKLLNASVRTVEKVVMQVPAPETLQLDDLFRRDPQLQLALVQGPAGPPVQLPLLLENGTLAQLLQDAMQPPKLLQPEPIDGRRCNRVEIENGEGTLTLWIDQQDNVLRRIDLPTREFQRLLSQDGEAKNVSLTINFHKARLNQPIDEVAFRFEVPADAKISETLTPELLPAPTAPRSEPEKLKRTKLWTAADVTQPGNVLVVESAGGQPRIFVIDGWRVVCEVDSEGRTVARHELDIPETAVVTYLRTAVDGGGKRYFVASANGQPQVFVFDENWKRVLEFPKPDEAGADGIWDVQMADLNGDGQLELCVGYSGDVGVMGISLDGARLWRDRSVKFVFRLAATEPDASGHRHLLCTHDRATISMFDSQGRPEKEIAVPNRTVYYVVPADLEGQGKNSYCALAGTATGENTALGISLDGSELWNYTLPGGVHARPIEVITDGQLAADGARQWLLAGPDGSVHIVAADGTPVDKFNTGAPLAGLAATKFGDQRVLLISNVLEQPDGERKATLDAWLVE